MSKDPPVMKCSHCGKLHWLVLMTDKSIFGHQVECRSCKSRGPMGYDRDNAIELWNWRAPEEKGDRPA